jgi:hypothetical protein
MKMRRQTAVVLSALVLAGLVSSLVVSLQGKHAAQPAPTRAEGDLAPLRLRWPVGTKTRYSLSWNARTSGLVAPGQLKDVRKLDFTSDTDAEIAVESLAERPGELEVAVSFEKVTRFDFRMAGQSATQDAAQAGEGLRGHRAFLTLSDRGEVRAIAFQASAGPEARSALKALAQQLSFTLPAGGETAWEADEPTGLGLLRVRYQRRGEVVQRTPVAFRSLDAVKGPLDGAQSLEGGATLRVDEQGLSALLDTETWSYTKAGMHDPSVASSFTFRLERLGREAFDLAALVAQQRGAASQGLSAAIVDQGLAARRDGRLADKLDDELLFKGLELFNKGGKPERGFIVSAGAYLRLHPELLPRLVARFSEKDLSPKGRGFVLDLLVQAGDAKAQAALLSTLQGEAARRDGKEYGMLVQRLTFLGEPQPEAARFLEDELVRARRASQVEAQQGAAAALGAVANRFFSMGNKEEADRALGELRQALRDTQDPSARLGVIAGLGNAAQPADVALLRALADDDDPKVRSQVAASLRAIDDPAARAALFSLAVDGSSGVAASAFASLNQQKLGGSDWSALGELVAQGKIASGADASLLELVRRHRQEAGPTGDQILRALLGRNSAPDNDLGSTIRGLLGITG